ncbi:hypothetical protein QMA69_05405 [Burkholderia pseudomallei]|uniref:hypothetical protein n=1 Tax=Burkholderia pseudomallei TaxID=28450 RepID=UPI002DB9CB3C|nr:hypothetical protein [Burkholderia pseudomallei]MEB5483934.1 hypothetical protein [Burkholderia pseudomallei]MEB5490811.1 hypothetical protein [Burkholderia pseudomallei]MEB5497485.1 hypothetical protein [Burkholderia pseudomallei]MEB5502785.1 hypothetical protein [Burkholderia pseudomallei]MEB5510165.1 hypothetical protein [Burkholderia pseudomallei]
MNEQQYRRAAALTDKQILELAKKNRRSHHGCEDWYDFRPHLLLEFARNLLAASTVEQHEAATADDRAAMVKSWGEISSQMFAKMTPWQFYEAGWVAARIAQPEPAVTDERAVFDYDDVVSICDAHGICLPVECVEMVVDIVKLSGLLAARTSSPNAAGAEPASLPQSVLDALRFYANRRHFNIDQDHQQFDTVSGEPANWLFSERDDDCTMIEDGSVARAALCGEPLAFEDPVPPIEGEAFGAPPPPAPASAPVGLTEEQRDVLGGNFGALEQAEDLCRATGNDSSADGLNALSYALRGLLEGAKQ